MSRMSNSRYLLSVDVGSTHIHAIIAELDHSQNFKVIGIGSGVTQGLENGEITVPKALCAALDRAIKRAERDSGIRPSQLLISIPPAQTQFGISYGLMMPKKSIITAEDRITCIQKSKAAIMTHEQVIQHVIPVEYKVNGQQVASPDGLAQGPLEVSTFAVLMKAKQASSLLDVTGTLGLEVKGLIYGPMGLSHFCLSDQERRQGALVIEIGAGFSSVTLFKNGAMISSHCIPIAGNRITQDLMTCLSIDDAEAERLKVMFGCSNPDELEPNETHVMTTVDRGRVDVKRLYLARIIEARVIELFQLLSKKAGIGPDFPYSIVIMGGTSAMRGIAQTAERVLGHPVRIGPHPNGPIDPSLWGYPTALGLIQLGIQTGVIEAPASDGWMTRIRRMIQRDWF